MTEEKIKTYTLRSKDRALIDFSLYQREASSQHSSDETYRIEIDKIYSDHEGLLPPVLKTGPVTEDGLTRWIRNLRGLEKVLAPERGKGLFAKRRRLHAAL